MQQQQHTREHPVCEQTTTQVDFSPAQMHAGNESLSLTTAGRLVEHLSEAAVNRDGENTENKMRDQREDIARPEFLQSSGIRDLHNPGDDSHLQERLVQRTQEAVEKCEGSSSDSISASSEYHTSHIKRDTTHIIHHSSHNSKTAPDVSHSRNDNRSNPSHAEQQSERLPEHRYKDKPREEAIRIKRPRDYIRQWRDSIDRLSTVSVTDDLGAPVSPLISHYSVSFPSRSKSLDAAGFRSAAVSNLEDYPLAHRSRSSHVLSTTHGSSQQDLAHSSNPSKKHQNHVETAMGTSSDRNIPAAARAGSIPAAARPGSIHRRPHQKTHLVSVYTGQSDESDVSEANLAGDNTLAASPALTSHNEHLLHYRNQQTILNKRFRSEPSSSGFRVQFRPVGNAGYQRLLSGAPVLRTSHRHHSLSPRRQAVDLNPHSPARLPAWHPHPMLSVPANYRPDSPQQKWPSTNIRKQEVDSRNIHVSIVSEVSPEALTQLAEIASQRADPGLKVRLTVTDDRPGKIGSVLPDVGHNTHKSAYPQVQNLVETRGRSLASIRRGGAGRVPRREAWEQERRHRNEDGCVVVSDAETQSGMIDLLFKEIKILREKIELLEGDDPQSRLDTECSNNRTGSLTDRGDNIQQIYRGDNIQQIYRGDNIQQIYRGDNIQQIYRGDNIQQIYRGDNIQQRLLSDHISTPTHRGHERALSCPLLKVSRQSPATRSLSRNAVRAGIVETKTASDSLVANLGMLALKSHLVSQPNINVPQKNDRQNVDCHQIAQPIKPDIYCADLTRSFEPRHLVKWKQLISRRDLSQLEIIELKQAVACVFVENDILQSKLSCAREEVHDKLRHTNGVLEDCRQHLAQSQRENMQLRVNLKEEQGRIQTCNSRIADLEGSILEMKTDNQQLQQELSHTAMLLDESMTKTQLEIDDLKSENWRLASRLRCVEGNNDYLREEVELLTQKQVRAVDTMDGLRKCLARTRQEREELFDELATLKDDQRIKVREIIKNYQEKGSQDEWEKEQNQAEKTENSAVSQVTRDLNCYHSRGRLPRRHSKSPNSATVHDGGSQYVKRSSPGAEIYPHRRGQTCYSSNWSPYHGRSSSVPAYSRLLSIDESIIDLDRQHMNHNYLQSRTNCEHSAIQSSWSTLDRPKSTGSRSPRSYRSSVPGSFTPRYEQTGSNKNSANAGLYRVQHRHTSPDYLSSTPSQYTLHPNNTTTDKRRERQVAEPRRKTPSYGRDDFSIRKSSPVLTKEQQQYADQLVQKYTGQISRKQPA